MCLSIQVNFSHLLYTFRDVGDGDRLTAHSDLIKLSSLATYFLSVWLNQMCKRHHDIVNTKLSLKKH